MQFDLQRPGDGEVFGEGFGLIGNDIGPAGGEALVGDHVFLLHAHADAVDVRDGLVGIADELIEAGRIAFTVVG